MKELFKAAREHMNKSIKHLQEELLSLRSGQLKPSVLEHIKVDYYSQQVPINQLATITVVEKTRSLLIEPWEKELLGVLEKALLKSDLGINPLNDGTRLRLVFPPLTGERKNQLIKIVHKKAEEAKIAIRNIRNNVKNQIKSKKEEKSISDDEYYRALNELQKISDEFIKQIDNLCKAKEKEIQQE